MCDVGDLRDGSELSGAFAVAELPLGVTSDPEWSGDAFLEGHAGLPGYQGDAWVDGSADLEIDASSRLDLGLQGVEFLFRGVQFGPRFGDLEFEFAMRNLLVLETNELEVRYLLEQHQI